MAHILTQLQNIACHGVHGSVCASSSQTTKIGMHPRSLSSSKLILQTWQCCLPALAAVFWTIWSLASSSGCESRRCMIVQADLSVAAAIPLLSHTLLAVINANTLQPLLDSAGRTCSSEKDDLTMREREREHVRSREGVMEDVILWSTALSLPFVISEWSSVRKYRSAHSVLTFV
jgi:hypothetical protein